MSPMLSARSQYLSCISTLCILFVAVAQATPQATFPFNSQVPTVARVNEPYSFQLSSSTFTPSTENFTYAVANQPAWLTIDSTTRTLSGTPATGDVGSSSFLLTAMDSMGASSMQCTLVVSNAPAPKLTEDVANQLASAANLSSSFPPVATLLPWTAFKFEFQRDSFIDIVQRKLYYYATLTDHTPLPSWLLFDDDALTLSGTAPELSGFPQSWSVDLIASDVEGFAGTTASFTIAIGTQQLAFVPEEQDWNVTTGWNASFTALGHQLFLNGEIVNPRDLKSASADVPEWMTFDPKTLAIRGIAPDNLGSQNFTVSVVDQQGNTATAVVNVVLRNFSLFDGQVGTIVAPAGKPFSYHFEDGLFSEQNIEVSVQIPEEAQWLHFDSTSRDLTGTVPSATESKLLQVTLTVSVPGSGQTQSQVFTIDVKGAGLGGGSTTTIRTNTRTIATNTPTSTHIPGIAIEQRNSGLSSGAIAAIVISSIVAASLMLLCLIWCCRKKKREHYGERFSVPSKKAISRPVPPHDESDAILVTTDLQRDVEEKAGGNSDAATAAPQAIKEDDEPPQLHLTLASHPANRKSKWKQISRISQTSSLGIGEEAIKADSNIPEWGQDAVNLYTPHDSFAIPADIAQDSRQFSQTSAAKRALRQLRDRHRSGDGMSLGVSTMASGSLARHSSNRVGKHRRKRSSLGGLSAMKERSSMASFSTRGTSVLSTRPSEFPVPPSTYSMSLSLPGQSILDADPKRKSIRLVGGDDDIAVDNRPIADKRQSFIRNRASVRVQSPLFAHGSRASSNDTRHTGNSSFNDSNSASAARARRSKNGKSLLATYSESSSLEPQPDGQGRPQARGLKLRDNKVRPAFPPKYPRAASRSKLYEDREEQERDSSWTSESMTSEDFIRAEMAKPRHERSFVVPGEASPTPPPGPPISWQRTISSHSTPSAETEAPEQLWRHRLSDKSSSPLSSYIQLADVGSPSVTRKASGARRNRLSEPISLVSADSMHKGKSRIAHTNSKRPISVEEVHSLSSLQAERDTATTAGSERWEDMDTEDEMEEAGLVAGLGVVSKGDTAQSARSDMSGPAFL